jgi:hypothetical protein
VPVDDVVARTADHKGLPLFLDHERRPFGLALSGLVETGELPDLVDNHLAWFLAKFAPSRQEPGDQLLSGVGDPVGDAVNDDRVLVSCKRYPAEPWDQWLLAGAFDSRTPDTR